jgi:hypothetical protein
MTDEIVFHRGTTMVRRLHLAPGEAMAWHRDPFQRVAVETSARVHRAVNVGKQPYEQVTIFLLDGPDAVAQPTEE